jgi:hypothetical protein
METALATAPAPAKGHQAFTIRATIKQLDSLTNAIAQIDTYNHWQPELLPRYHKEATEGVAWLWHNAIYPIEHFDVEFSSELLEGFGKVLNCIQDVIVGAQSDLLSPFIESAYNLIEMMAGDKKHLIFGEEEAQ